MSLLSWLGRLVVGSRPQFHGYDAEHLDPNVYYHFKNLIIPTARGTSEIDHLIVSRYGLFVFELKDRSGWIFGDEKAKTWTAIHFGKKFRFENPLHQNFGHVMALRDLLGISRGTLHAAVVFRGDFQFKTAIPHGVLCHRYVSWVKSQTIVLLGGEKVDVNLGLEEASFPLGLAPYATKVVDVVCWTGRLADDEVRQERVHMPHRETFLVDVRDGRGRRSTGHSERHDEDPSAWRRSVRALGNAYAEVIDRLG